jgi:hypothetical protein
MESYLNAPGTTEERAPTWFDMNMGEHDQQIVGWRRAFRIGEPFQ